MAQKGFDPAFGLQGTYASHVSGFGGWPMAVFMGVDGRPTLVCSAPDQRPADQGISPGGRFRGPPLTTIRIVSLPPNGRPMGNGSSGIVVSTDPPADEPIYLARAITRANRIAVLGSVIRANRQVPTLWVFSAGPIAFGIAKWTLERRIELTHLARFAVRCCGIGWGDNGDVLVVAPELSPGPRESGWSLRLFLDGEGSQSRRRTVTIRLDLDLPNGFELMPRVTAVCRERSGDLLIGCSIDGTDPQGGLRPIGWLDGARASVVRLRPSGSALRPDDLEPDPGFAQQGVWVASIADGEITTVDRMELDEPASVIVAGRARRAGTWSLYAASLDPVTGALAWSSYPGDGVRGEPSGLAVENGRILLCGSTLDVDHSRTVDPAEAVLTRLSTADGQLDPGFGVGGVARYQLNGATYATALGMLTTGQPLVASVLRWGWNASVATFHACLSRFTAAGQLDGSFGSGGIVRHDGLGDVRSVAVDQAGHVWSAGVTKRFRGMVPGYWPADPPRPDFQWLLNISKLTAEGELDGTWGEFGIRTNDLEAELPTGEGEIELASLVPLTAGGAILAGSYYRRVLTNTVTGETGPEFRGSWFVRLGADVRRDPTFGTNGLRVYPQRGPIELVRELANGTLQGYDRSGGWPEPLRLAANGDAAPRFGPDGVKPITKSPITMPSDIESDGEWFALVWGAISASSMRWTVGLVRCDPDGVIDPNFGAGAAAPSAGCFVDVNSVHTTRTLLDPDWNDQGGPYQTLRLADETLLTIWSLSWQESRWRPWGMVLLAWTAEGLPRAVAGWGGKPARIIRNPLSLPPLGSPFTSWVGWRNQCAALQPDGSILVGLAGDDADETRANVTPRPLRQSAYFCRLVPPEFDVDPGFGSAGILVRRLPDDGYQRFAANDPRSSSHLIDSQVPERLALVGSRLPGQGPNAVVAIACRAVYQPHLSQGGLQDMVANSPDLPFDGSVGVARLV